eukprot:14605759-Alexandrium_andersonii.AAC.1
MCIRDSRKSVDRMPTVTTAGSAEGEPLRFSAYQYKPSLLLHRDADWRGARPEEVQGKVRALIAGGDAPVEALEGRDAICRNAGPHSPEGPPMHAAAKWLAKNAEAAGVRAASVAERARGAAWGATWRS